MLDWKPKSHVVYRIIDRSTDEPVGSYSRACHDEYDFKSPMAARNANCNGLFADDSKYKIAAYKVTYELIADEVYSEVSKC